MIMTIYYNQILENHEGVSATKSSKLYKIPSIVGLEHNKRQANCFNLLDRPGQSKKSKIDAKPQIRFCKKGTQVV